MSEMSVRFGLPLLQSGQAQKELFHNEALCLLDLAIHPAVEAMGVDTPPASPEHGQCWIIGDSPTGAWLGQGGALAGWTTGGWRFVQPRAGMLAWVRTAGMWAYRSEVGWVLGEMPARNIRIDGQQVIGPRQSAIGLPDGGAVVDGEARNAIAAILAALGAHGLIAG